MQSKEMTKSSPQRTTPSAVLRDRLSQANGFRAVANTEDLIKLMGDLNLHLEARHDEMVVRLY